VDSLRLFKYNATDGLEALPLAPSTLNCANYEPLSANGTNEPASFAGTAWRGAARWLANVVGPSRLFAATMFGTTPKGLGGLAGSFSDFGGAVLSSAPQAIDSAQPTPSWVG